MRCVIVSLVALSASCSGDGRGPSPYALDDVLRLNHVQAKGTHNSYHLEPPNPVDPSHEYTQPPLDEQLALHGVRQLELDLHYRLGEGFEVFHIPLVDEETSCRRFVDCLALVRGWSDDNPWHLPIAIWLEPKDEADFLLDPTLGEISGRYAEIEAEILSVFPRRRILTPDDLRGGHPDLPTAIAVDGWPTLGELRGKVIFSMLDSGPHRDEYLADAPNLAGKLMFVDAGEATDPYAAFFKINDARADSARIQGLVQAGFIVTSNVDGAGGDPVDHADKLAASLAAGIHYGSSDFPAPVPGVGYWFDLPAGTPAVCNPVYPASACQPPDIEALP